MTLTYFLYKGTGMTITEGDIIVSLSFTFMGVMWFLYMKYVIWEYGKNEKVTKPFTLEGYNVSNIKDEKLRRLILSLKSGININENMMKLIKHTSGIEIAESFGFIKFDSSEIYEIKEINFSKKSNGDLDLFYSIERSSDGLIINLNAHTLKETMVGCNTKTAVSNLQH